MTHYVEKQAPITVITVTHTLVKRSTIQELKHVDVLIKVTLLTVVS
jgi:hypothetical protein